ncbi:lipopolysaccharide heptosyltransferase II [bacterium]|nr:lipopolysaccharide heptosyltransferase II [bacterium]
MRQKILVLRYRFIGDTILTVPFLRNLRRAEPDALIHLVLAPVSGDVLKGIPYVDQILYWDPQTIHGDCTGTHRKFRDKWGFVRDLRMARYDKVYILKRSFSSAVMGFMTGAPQRIGFDTEGRGFLLTTRVPYDHSLHEVENFLNCLRSDGIEVKDDYLEAWIQVHERKSAVEFLENQGWRKGDPVVAIHPFAAVKERGWPLNRFIQLANIICGWIERAAVLWLGGKKDIAEEGPIRTGFFGKGLMAIGRTDIRQTMALLSLSSLFVGNDSGIMHLAAALNVPVVAIFGPQSEVKFGPWGDKKRCAVVTKRLPCHPCRQKFFTECMPGAEGRPLCLESIGVEDVMKEIGRLVNTDRD